MGNEGPPQVTLRFFAGAREAAGTNRETVSGRTVGDVLDDASRRHGPAFVAVLAVSRVWRNGDPAERDDRLRSGDEVAVLPPVSGGAG